MGVASTDKPSSNAEIVNCNYESVCNLGDRFDETNLGKSE